MENIIKENFSIWDWIISVFSLILVILSMWVASSLNAPIIFGLILFPPGTYILYIKIKKLTPKYYKKVIIITLIILILASVLQSYFSK